MQHTTWSFCEALSSCWSSWGCGLGVLGAGLALFPAEDLREAGDLGVGVASLGDETAACCWEEGLCRGLAELLGVGVGVLALVSWALISWCRALLLGVLW